MESSSNFRCLPRVTSGEGGREIERATEKPKEMNTQRRECEDPTTTTSWHL